MADKTKCPNIMGCMGNKFRCSNGDCVDIEEGETCPVNTCPKEAPYKCLDNGMEAPLGKVVVLYRKINHQHIHHQHTSKESTWDI